jgi:excisionase family DNA binding protein
MVIIDKEVMNTDEAAQFLGLKPFTIREYAKRGVIPAKKIGKQWRFVKADLLAWLRSKETSQGG